MPTASPRARLAVVIAAVLLARAGMAAIAGRGDRTPGAVPTIAPPPGQEDEAPVSYTHLTLPTTPYV